jgi:hypothetical protein
VLKRLPAETEEQAFLLGAFVRCREIKSVGDLLRALLAYVLCVSSFRQLGSWAVLLGVANISDTAWRKRLGQATAWLLWLLGALLAGPQVPREQSTSSGLGRIILVDATRLKQVGGTGDDWRVHSAYDLRASRPGPACMSPINIQRSHSSIFSYNALIFLLLTEDMVTAKILRMRINSKHMLFFDLFRVPVRCWIDMVNHSMSLHGSNR